MPNTRKPRRERQPPAPPDLRVAALVYDGLATFEFGIAADVFALRRPGFEPWYDFAAVPAEPGPLRATGGVTLASDTSYSPRFEALEKAGLIIAPGWFVAPRREPPGLIAALRRAHARGARLLTICSGSFLLARAGLLAGKRATTHWRYLDALARQHPDIRVERDVLYVEDGNILTSAGSAAGLDCCLHLVRRDFGVAVANKVARSLVVPPMREGGQAQYVERPAPPAADRLSATLDWARARLDRPILLEEGAVSVDEAAAAVGLGVDALRRHFRARLGVSPSRYRASFGASAPARRA